MIPLDNVDQNYYDTLMPAPNDNTYFTDLNKPGSVVGDRYLLPVTITGAAGESYSLTIPGDVKVWGSQDRTGSIATDTSFTMPGSGTMTVYLQGFGLGSGTLTLNYIAGFSTTPVDHLNTMVFAFTGPADVPNYSTYGYSVIGAPVDRRQPLIIRWDLPANDGGAELKSLPISADVVVQWGSGGADQRHVIYWATKYYQWDYDVNVVQIAIGRTVDDLGNPEPAVNVSQSTSQLFGTGKPNQFSDDPTGHLRTVQDPLSGAASVLISSAHADGTAISWRAAITMTGPHGNWGVDRMMVGFTQIVTSINYEAHYEGDGTLEASLNDETPLHDTAPGAAPGAAYWYPQVSPFYPAANLCVVVNALQQKSSQSDGPRLLIPEYQNQAANLLGGDHPLASIDLTADFNLFISVGILDRSAAHANTPLNNVYTILAEAPPAPGNGSSWSWQTTGDFDDFIYTPMSSLLQGPAATGWNSSVRGSVIDTSYGQGNLAFQGNTWS